MHALTLVFALVSLLLMAVMAVLGRQREIQEQRLVPVPIRSARQ